ncbi:MAG: hypothetical protein MJE68_06355, partial [Proteobacteria bacterium]|nr:hypothetical protein [Pseudomonadota bacterium]
VQSIFPILASPKMTPQENQKKHYCIQRITFGGDQRICQREVDQSSVADFKPSRASITQNQAAVVNFPRTV